MDKTVLVKFTRPNTPYNRGEVAGFDEKTAARFCDGKNPVAVRYKPTGVEKAEGGVPDAGSTDKNAGRSKKK